MIDPRNRLLEERSRLLAQRADLTGDHAGMVEASRDSNADDEHDPEGSTIAFERSQLASLLRQVDDRLAEVDAALLRVEAGTYGRCERCGRPVEPERLQARPTARTHVAC
jgi:DnaK suppressor protein